MPELPEVETIVRGISCFQGARIQRVTVRDPKLNLPTEALQGARIEAIQRRGKYVVVLLGERRGMLVFHMRMSGRLTGECPEEQRQYVRVSVHCNCGDLEFVNPRRLGTVEYSTDGFPHELGIEPLTDGFTPRTLSDVLQQSRRPIKTLLLDQRKLAGLGNIYVCESLWSAAVDPCRSSDSLCEQETADLWQAVSTVLQQAIGSMGSSIGHAVTDYKTPDGGWGTYQERFAVYQREGEPCPRCQEPVARIRQGGRSTYFCPACQQ